MGRAPTQTFTQRIAGVPMASPLVRVSPLFGFNILVPMSDPSRARSQLQKARFSLQSYINALSLRTAVGWGVVAGGPEGFLSAILAMVQVTSTRVTVTNDLIDPEKGARQFLTSAKRRDLNTNIDAALAVIATLVEEDIPGQGRLNQLARTAQGAPAGAESLAATQAYVNAANDALQRLDSGIERLSGFR